jgi:hypothetical protein
MTIEADDLQQRLRLHLWLLVDTYGGIEALASVLCDHDLHQADGEFWASLMSGVLRDFVKTRTNRDVVLAALVEA